ncbi:MULTISPECIES: hypothetical protein [Sphingomonas]|uniref:Uncharacterized protein n=1 Tax=Sphingomonas molluscorum TaxID=418184 RepID=A0ABU8QA12_9SPHN|nr:hypothetical protein [Sphingomonas sp. JUb134]MBM7407918.1 hypothetical protein [Sphingomonas sp. JUb134]
MSYDDDGRSAAMAMAIKMVAYGGVALMVGAYAGRGRRRASIPQPAIA